MSTTIDQRVVEMQFDNRHFESNVKTSLSTIEKLKQSLNFSGATQGFNDISAAAKNVNMSSLGGAVESVKVKFSALEVMAVTALANITNSAVNASKRMVSALTIDPIKTGFNEYELKMGAIQTIMASTGESLATVNEYLNELNEYSDKTIYSFSDMTQNIGKFTNAGVKLEDAVLAMKGISNEAAVSGANANEASRAMYNFAQAISAGYVKLIDWKSIELANMATVEFKEQLLETALALGTVVKEGDMYRSTTTDANGRTSELFSTTRAFNESLSAQWMTTEVLVSTLREYADETTEIGAKASKAATEVKTFTQMFDALKESAQSGWAQTWEHVFGNFEEGKTLWTSINNVIGDMISKSADSRNNLIKGAFSSNWDKLVDKLGEANISAEKFEETLTDTLDKNNVSVENMVKKYGSLGKAFQAGAIDSKLLKKAIDSITGGVEKLQLKIDGIFSKGSVGDEVKEIQNALKQLGYDLGKFGEAGDGLDGIIGPVTEKAIKAFQEANNLTVDGIVGPETIKALNKAADALDETADGANKVKESFDELIDGIEELGGRELLIESFKNVFKELSKILESVKNAWNKVFDKFDSSDLYKIIKSIHGFTEELNISKSTTDKLEATFEGLFTILKFVKDVFGEIVTAGFKLLKTIFTPFADTVLTATSGIGKFIKKISELSLKGFKPLSESMEVVLEFVEKFVEFIGNIFGTTIDFAITKIGEWITKFKETEIFKTMSERFREAADVIAGALSNVEQYMDDFNSTKFGKGLGKVIDWFSEIGRKIKNSEFISKAISGITDAFSALVGIFKNLNFKLPEFKFDGFRKLLNFLETNDYSGVSGTVTGVFKYLKQIFTLQAINFKNNFLTKVSEFFVKHGTTMEAGLEKAKEVVASFIEFIFATDEISLPVIADLAKKLLEVAILYKVLNIVSDVSGSIESVGDALNNFAKAAKWRAIGDAFKGIAIALGAFTACLLIIDEMDDMQKTKEAAKLLGQVLLVMAGVIAALILLSKSVTGSINLITAVGSLVGIALAMFLLVSTLNKIDKMDMNNAESSIGLMIQIILALALGMGIVGKLCGKGTIGSAAAILTMMAALKMIPEILQQYAEFPWHEVEGVIPHIVGMLLGLALILRIASGGIKAGANTGGLAVLMLAIVVSLKMMLGVIKELGRMDKGEMKQGIGAMAIILGMVTAMLAIINLTNKGNGVLKKGERSINNFTGLAAALLGIAASIAILGYLPLDVLKQGGAAVVVILGMLTLMISTIGKSIGQNFNFKNILTLLIGMGLIIAEIAAITYILGKNVGWENAIGAAGSISLLLIALAATCKILGGIKGNINSGIKTAYKLSGLLVIFGAILVGMSKIETQNSVANATALSELLLALSGACLILSKSAPWISGTISAAYAMSGVVAVLAGILGLMSYLGVGASLETATALSELLLALSGACWILSISGPFVTGAIGAAYAMSGVVAVLAIILGTMSKLEVGPTLEIATSLSILLLALSGACWILGTISPIAAAASAGAWSLMGLLGVVAGVILAIGAIGAAIPGSVEFIDRMVVVLEKIGTAIGSFFGGIVGGFKEAADVKTFTDRLLELIDGITSFVDKAKTLDSDAVGAIKNVASAVYLLTAAEFVDAISQFITRGKNMTDFTTKLTAFGEGLVAFRDSISALTPDDAAKIKVAADAGKQLATMSDVLPRTGGWWQDIIGEKDAEDFGKKIAAFGGSLIQYSKSIAGLNNDDIEKIRTSAEAAKAMADMAAALPRTGGDFQKIIGEKDMQAFGQKAVVFGESLVDYSNVIKNLDEAATGKIAASADAAKALANVAGALPRADGMWQDIIGEKDIGDFGRKLIAFGKGILEYSKSVENLPEDAATKIESSGAAVDALVAVADKLDREGGWGEAIVGTKDPASFGSGMATLGKAINSYVSEVSKIPEDAVDLVDSSKDVVDAMNDTSDKVPSVKDKNFANVIPFGNNMLILAGKIIAYINKVEAIPEDAVDVIKRSKSAVDKMKDTANEVPKADDANFANVIPFGNNMMMLAGKIVGYINAANQITDDGITSIKRSKEAVIEIRRVCNQISGKFESIGTSGFNSAISNLRGLVNVISSMSGKDFTGASGFASALNDLGKANVTNFIKAFRDANSTVKNIGKDLISALVAGIESGKPKVANSTKSIITAIANSITKSYNSFAKNGKDMVSHFAKGLAAGKPAATISIKSIVSAVASQAKLGYSGMRSAGQHLGNGLIAGIGSKAEAAYRAGYALGRAAVRGEMDGQESNSPSKATVRAGRWLGEGLIIAIKKMGSSVYSAGSEMGRKATMGISNAISTITDTINSDIDVQPTIRPVLDLSAVSAGAGTLNNLFGTNPSVGVLARVNSISSAMNKGQNGVNGDVISAIRDLKDSLGGHTGDTYMINGVTYDDGSNITDAVKTLVRAARVERRS